ncbi:TlpA family protein disulfide reductase [Dyadobacter frigoris]
MTSPVVVFTRNVYDYSKKSTFLIGASFDLGIDSLKSLLAQGRVDSFLVISHFWAIKCSCLRGSRLLEIQSSSVPLKRVLVAIGTKIGFIARNFDKSDILSGKQLVLNAMKGKYVLLDFWGTRCAPCMQIKDDIKKIHQNVDNNKMAIIGVCYDDNITKVATFIRKKRLNGIRFSIRGLSPQLPNFLI